MGKALPVVIHVHDLIEGNAIVNNIANISGEIGYTNLCATE